MVACDYAAAWSLMEENLRLYEAQVWLHANGLGPEHAGVLVTRSSGMDSTFEAGRLTALRSRYAPGWPPEYWGVLSDQRIVGEDLEIVILVDSRVAIPADDALLDENLACQFLTRFSTHGWMIAGFDYQPPVPGWPPSDGVLSD
jgi:hypothetical protein